MKTSIRATLVVALACVVLQISPLRANMAILTDPPARKSVAACEKWASKQDEDAVFMWGMLENGDSSSATGLKRLARYCLDGSKPEIVGFGSSAGFDEAYCRKHGAQGICKRAAAAGGPEFPIEYQGAWQFAQKKACPAGLNLEQGLGSGEISVNITSNTVRWIDSQCILKRIKPIGEQISVQLSCEYDDGKALETQKWGQPSRDGSPDLLVMDTSKSYEVLSKCQP